MPLRRVGQLTRAQVPPLQVDPHEILNYERVSVQRKSLFYGPSLYTPQLTHMLFVDLRDNLSCKENYNLPQRSLIILGFCVRPLCDTQLLAALGANDIRRQPHLELWCSHGDLPALRSMR